jgi:hypothetical protein
MGGGSYSINSSTGAYDRSIREAHVTAYAGIDYKTKSREELFTQRNINNAMSPYGVKVRESRDSAEHPNSLAIIIALDETGSMGSVPHYLVKEGFPDIMGNIIQKGEKDPQVMFLGIGDHECDEAPLQVSQFESSDELLDKWLTTVYLEGGGGGNNGESYSLAWYFAAQHTSIDCFEKRGRKGFLFTIGDEPVLKIIPAHILKKLMGEGQYENYTAEKLYDMAREKYNVFHVHIKETSSGSRQRVIDGWKQLLTDNLIVAERHEDVAKLIADKINEVKSKPFIGLDPGKKAETEEIL